MPVREYSAIVSVQGWDAANTGVYKLRKGRVGHEAVNQKLGEKPTEGRAE